MSEENTVNPVQEERDAIVRVALTADGALLHRYLRRVLETVYDTPQKGALLSHNGRRTLARDIMRLMAPSIEASSGRPGTDSPVLTARTSGVSVARASRARVSVTPGDGWADDSSSP